MRLATLLAFVCYLAAVCVGAGWFVAQSVPVAVALVAAGLALGIVAGVEILPPRR